MANKNKFNEENLTFHGQIEDISVLEILCIVLAHFDSIFVVKFGDRCFIFVSVPLATFFEYEL